MEQLSFGQRLRRERKSHNLNQKDLADKIQTTVLSINRWEHDKYLPHPDMRTKLYEFFGKTAETFGMLSHKEVVWNVPHLRNQYFTGREQVLARLHNILSAENTVALVQHLVLTGLGGIGKTQTAVEYAYRYSDEYTSVLWVQADSRESLVANFAALASLLDLPEQTEADQACIVAAVKRWLQAQEEQPWLLIFDNADDIAMVFEFLPTKGAGATLLTTRSQIKGKHIKKIDIERMSRKEGVQFLLHRSGALEDSRRDEVSKEERQSASALYEIMDGLPLALDQAAAYIEEHECSLAEYLSLYQTQWAVLLQRRGSLNERDYPHSVATTWLLSFQKVEQASSLAADLLRLCAFLHPDAIPEEILAAGAAELRPDLEAIASNPLLLYDVIEIFRRYSLIRRNAEKKTLTIHRLVQAVIQGRMDNQTKKRWAERAILAVNATFPHVEFGSWPQCERLLPHALLAAHYIETEHIIGKEAGRLLHETASYLADRARYGEAEPLYQRTLHIREQSLELDPPLIAESLNNLATLYRIQSKYTEAEPLYQRALEIRKQFLGPDHVQVAENLSNLALLYADQGRYTEAEPLYRQALKLFEQALGLDHLKSALCVNNLALLCWRMEKYTEAESLFLQALVIRKQLLKADHPDMAQSLNNLALLYWQLGRYEEAEPLYQQSLQMYEKVLGPGHPYVAENLNNLADLYRVQGRYAEAESLFVRASQIFEQALGPDHPHIVENLNDLAELYRVQGRYAEAEPLYQQALKICEQQLDPQHPDTVATREFYSVFLREMGREDETAAILDRFRPKNM